MWSNWVLYYVGVVSGFASWKMVSLGFLALYMSNHTPSSFSPCRVILALSFALPLKLLILSRYSIWFTRIASWRWSKSLYSRQGFTRTSFLSFWRFFRMVSLL